jgi:hypothetical protein
VFQDLISQGHRPEDLKDGYTIGQLHLYTRALALNRQQEVWRQAVAISLGIRDALGSEGKLVTLWLEGLAHDAPKEAKPPAKLSPPAMAWFAGLPVKGKHDGE